VSKQILKRRNLHNKRIAAWVDVIIHQAHTPKGASVMIAYLTAEGITLPEHFGETGVGGWDRSLQ